MAMSDSILRRLSEWDVLTLLTAAMPSRRRARQKQEVGIAIFAPITSLETGGNDEDVNGRAKAGSDVSERTDVAPNCELQLQAVVPFDHVDTVRVFCN